MKPKKFWKLFKQVRPSFAKLFEGDRGYPREVSEMAISSATMAFIQYGIENGKKAKRRKR